MKNREIKGCGVQFEKEIYVSNGWHETCLVNCGNQGIHEIHLCEKCIKKEK